MNQFISKLVLTGLALSLTACAHYPAPQGAYSSSNVYYPNVNRGSAYPYQSNNYYYRPGAPLPPRYPVYSSPYGYRYPSSGYTNNYYYQNNNVYRPQPSPSWPHEHHDHYYYQKPPHDNHHADDNRYDNRRDDHNQWDNRRGQDNRDDHRDHDQKPQHFGNYDNGNRNDNRRNDHNQYGNRRDTGNANGFRGETMQPSQGNQAGHFKLPPNSNRVENGWQQPDRNRMRVTQDVPVQNNRPQPIVRPAPERPDNNRLNTVNDSNNTRSPAREPDDNRKKNEDNRAKWFSNRR